MFDKLSRSMEKARKLMTGTDKLTAENMKEPLKEIRRALLEADVSLPVVRRFIKKVEEKALGQEVGSYCVLTLQEQTQNQAALCSTAGHCRRDTRHSVCQDCE